jgi:copper resistance protein D
VAQLLDVFGFLSVVLRGVSISLQSLVIGGLVFSLLAGTSETTRNVLHGARHMVVWAAVALALTQSAYVAADTGILMGTTTLRFSEVVGANFFLAGCVSAVIALIIALLQSRAADGARVLALTLAAGLIATSVATSHAAARLEDRWPLILLTGLHHAATATWIGGLPFLLMALARCGDTNVTRLLSARFSRMAQISVCVLLIAGAGLALVYIESPSAVLGTAYGAMVAAKVAMFGMLLVLGAFNFFIVRRVQGGDTMLLARLRRFAEAEVGIGFTVILAAASLTSQPPAADLVSSRVPISEVVQRFTPVWPRLSAPYPGEVYPNVVAQRSFPDRGEFESFVPGQLAAPITAAEIALSEFNHHWAGVFVLMAGLLALAARAGFRWARHWPFAFLGLGIFIFFMADADYWPLGSIPFWKGFAVSEVLQHRLILPLVLAFAWFEWRVRTGRAKSPRAALVFPLVCALGGAILLTHTHSLNNAREDLLAELSHIPIALLGVIAGWSRWLELRLPEGPRKSLSWLWPICFALIGAWLLNYRES